MFSPPRRLRRLALMAPMLLILLLSSSQSQQVLAYSPASTPHPKRHWEGFIDFWLWSDVLFHNEAQTIRAVTPMAEYTVFMSSMILHKDFYSFETEVAGGNDGSWYTQCGHFVHWDVSILVSPPPECKATFAMRTNLLPGFCWGQFGGFPYAEFADPEYWNNPGYVEASFIIGEEVFKEIHYEGGGFDGSIYIYLEHVALYGLECEHHAYLTGWGP